MKRTVSVLLLLTLLSFTFNSCKKGADDDDDEECDLTIANVAGKYKLVSAKYVNGNTETDALHTIYDDCELDDINELKADKTFVYSDAGTVCSPSGSTSGTWNISGRTLILNSGFSEIVSFNCKDLVVTYRDGSNTVKETYRKQ
jgi:hypothetical protein